MSWVGGLVARFGRGGATHLANLVWSWESYSCCKSWAGGPVTRFGRGGAIHVANLVQVVR